MRYKEFIKAQCNVSVIGLGAWQLGINSGWKSLSEEEALRQIHQSIEMGVNFFDTAPNYGLGSSELRLGKALKAYNRQDVIVNTKFGHTVTGELNFEAHSIRGSLEGSLRRLQMDYVDSLIVHNPPFSYLDGNANDHYEILERLKEEGKILAYGASLDTAEEMNLLMKTTGSEVIEAFFNILHQDVKRAFDLALEKGTKIIAKIPLDSGWLGGKYNHNTQFEDIRSRWTRDDIRIRATLVNALKELCGDKYILPELAMAYCLSYEAITTVIPGNTRIEQLKQNISSVDLSLPHHLLQELEDFYDQKVKPLQIPW